MFDEMVYLNELDKKQENRVSLLQKHVNYLIDELERASKNSVTHLKIKSNVPTVIEYQGRRYVLDHVDRHK